MEDNENKIENWQQVMQEFGSPADQVEQPQQPNMAQQQPQQPNMAQPQQAQPNPYAQQPNFAQQGQPNPYAQQPNYTQQAQPNPYAQQPNYTQQAQPNPYAQQPNYAQQPSNSYSQPTTALPAYDASSFAVMPAKKKSKAPVIIIVIVLIAALIGLGIFLFFKFFNKGADYETLERGFFDKVGASVSSSEVTEIVKKPYGSDFDVSFAPGGDLAETKLVGSVDVDVQNGAAKVSADLKAGDEKYLTFEMWRDGDNVVINVPELYSKYLVMPISSLNVSNLASTFNSPTYSYGMDDIYADYGNDDLYGDTDMSDLLSTDITPTMSDYDSYGSGAYSSYINMASSLANMIKDIDSDQLDAVTDVLTKTYFDTFTGEKGKGETLTLDSVSVNCDTITVTFTYEGLMNFVKNLMDNAKSDSTIMGMLEDLNIGENELDYFSKSIESALEKMEDGDKNKEFLSMKLYTLKNEIVGRSFIVNGEEIVKLIHVDNDGTFAYGVIMNASGNTATMSATGTSSNDKLDAVINYTGNGQQYISATCSFTKGDYVNGTVDLTINSDGKSYKASLSIASDASSMSFGVSAETDGSKVADVTAAFKNKDYAAPQVPELTDANSINTYTATQDELNEFSTQTMENVVKFVGTLQKISKPDIIVSYYTNMMDAIASTQGGSSGTDVFDDMDFDNMDFDNMFVE